jgi:hypothetical protein
MIGFIGTSLKLQPIITANTLNSLWILLWMNYESCPTNALKNLLNWVRVWVLCYDRRSAGQSVLEQSTHLGLTTRSLLHVWQLRSCSCGASSLTRGRVCPLYMLLALASAVFLWSESLGTLDHILLSHIWEFPFRLLLRLAGSRWRYSTPPPHVHVLEISWIELSFEFYVTTDGQPASLSWSKAPIWGLRPDLYYLCDSYGLDIVGRPLWREDGSVFYICCWPLPAQSFFGPSPLGLHFMRALSPKRTWTVA